MLLSRALLPRGQNQAESLSKLAEAGLDLIHDEVTRCIIRRSAFSWSLVKHCYQLHLLIVSAPLVVEVLC